MTLMATKICRRWTSRPQLQALYSLALAGPRIRATLGLSPTGGGVVGFKVDGDALDRTEAEIVAAGSAQVTVHPLVTQDLYGRCTVRCWRRNADLGVLAGDLFGVADRLSHAGYGGSLRYASADFAEVTGRRTRKLRLVYLFDRGTFYPSSPADHQPLDRTLELRARTALNGLLPLEPDMPRRLALS